MHLKPRQKLLLLLGHRDQSSNDPTKDYVSEYLGKQMPKRTLPNAPSGELVWQQADRPKGLAYITHSSWYYLISLIKILILTFVPLQNPFLICWILQDSCLVLATALPLPPNSISISLKSKFVCRTFFFFHSPTFRVDNWRHLMPLNQNWKTLA